MSRSDVQNHSPKGKKNVLLFLFLLADPRVPTLDNKKESKYYEQHGLRYIVAQWQDVNLAHTMP